MLSTYDEIKSEAVVSFRNQLNSDHVIKSEELLNNQPSLIFAEANDVLSAFPSDEEIYQVINDMNPNSSAGPDRYNGFFYTQYWEVIKGGLVLLSVIFLQGRITKIFGLVI